MDESRRAVLFNLRVTSGDDALNVIEHISSANIAALCTQFHFPLPQWMRCHDLDGIEAVTHTIVRGHVTVAVGGSLLTGHSMGVQTLQQHISIGIHTPFAKVPRVIGVHQMACAVNVLTALADRSFHQSALHAQRGLALVALMGVLRRHRVRDTQGTVVA